MASVLKVDTVLESTPGAGTNFGGVGSASVPTLSIGSQTNKGFYDAGTNKIGVSVGGSKVGEIGVGYGGFTGNIIQVVSTQFNSNLLCSFSNWTNISGFLVSITPRYSTSRILIFTHLIGGVQASGGRMAYRVLRNSTPIGVGDVEGSRDQATAPLSPQYDSNENYAGHAASTFLDSPNTISIITYQVQGLGIFRTNSNYTNTQLSGDYAARFSSSITVLEVQQ